MRMAVVVFSGRLWAVGTRWRGRGSGVQDGAFTPSPLPRHRSSPPGKSLHPSYGVPSHS